MVYLSIRVYHTCVSWCEYGVVGVVCMYIKEVVV